ncbi:MAG: hypothetical protein ABR976_10810 [Terracidiphilus sp.]
MVKSVWIAFALFLVFSTCCMAQSNDEDAGGLVAGEYGAGGRTGSGGVFLGLYDTGGLQRLASPRHFLAPGFFLELGLAGPTPKTPVDGLFSFNFQSTYNLHHDPTRSRRTPALLFFDVGYSRFFVTGNVADYGGGVMWHFAQRNGDFKGLRVEYREFYVAGWGRQPTVRISFENGGDLQ